MNNQMPPVDIPFGYATEWWLAAWRVARQNYAMALATSMTALGVPLLLAYLVNRIGAPSWIADHVVSLIPALMAPGLLLISRKWLAGEPAAYEEIFALFKDTDLRKRYLPYLGVSILTGILSSAVFYVSPDLSLNMLLVGGLIGAAMWSVTFAGPLIVFRNMPIQEALKLSVKTSLTHWLPLLATLVIGLGMAIVMAVAFLLPFFLVFLPMCAPVIYLIYATIFERVDVGQVGRPKVTPLTPVI
ncbi:MAG: hypothetical protein AB7F86_08080 [Bdellovibrionales bacterium]